MIWRSNKNRNDCIRLFNGQDFILFDTETTGLHPEKGDRIIECSAMKLRAIGSNLGIVDTKDIYIKPPFPVDAKITEITGISNQELLDKPKEEDVFDEIYSFFGEAPVLAAYNTPFDVGMMQAMYRRYGKSFYPVLMADILEMVRDHVPVGEVDNFKQETIATLYGVNEGIRFHRASDDIMATARLLKTMRQEYIQHPEVNGTVKPWLRGCWYFKGYNRKQAAVYVSTPDSGNLIYSQYQRGWYWKNNNGKAKNPGEYFNMEAIQAEVIQRLNLVSVDDLQKMTEKKMEIAKNYWFKRKAVS